MVGRLEAVDRGAPIESGGHEEGFAGPGESDHGEIGGVETADERAVRAGEAAGGSE